MFNPQQKHTILTKLGYNGPADEKSMEQFVASNPAAAAKIGKFENAAKKIMTPPPQMANPGTPPVEMAEGGLPVKGTAAYNVQTYDPVSGKNLTPTQLANRQRNFPEQYSAASTTAADTTATDTTGTTGTPFGSLLGSLTDGTVGPDGTKDTTGATEGTETVVEEKPQTLLQKATADYMTAVPTIEAPTAMGATQISGQDLDAVQAAQIAEGTGQLTGDVSQVQAQTADAEVAAAPVVQEAITYDPTKVSGEIAAELEKLKAAQGLPSELATVRGQMSLLMQDFDEGTPPWASGAMRTAMQTMAARGLGSSSMAGQAIVQAAMESALPIAGADARTQAEFEMKNLDNRQQTAIFKTQQRISGLLSDQASENAAKNFNAQSENQVNMFRSNMQATVAQFNASQINAIRQFNAGETNAINKFNADIKEQREQFNAKNDVLIQQANVTFRNNMFEAKMGIKSQEAVAQAQITSQETMKQMALDAERKMKQAELAHQASQAQMAREQQAEQAAMERAFQAEQATADRALTVLTTTMAADTQKELSKMASSDANKAGFGKLIGTIIGLK